MIRKPNKNNDGAHILQIIDVAYSGDWFWTETGPVARHSEQGYYYMEVCEGSVYDNEKAEPRTDIGAAAVHKIEDVDVTATKEQP